VHEPYIQHDLQNIERLCVSAHGISDGNIGRSARFLFAGRVDAISNNALIIKVIFRILGSISLRHVGV